MQSQKYKLNEELLKKYQNDFEFHKRMDQRQNNAIEALKTNPAIDIDENLLQIFSMEEEHEVYFYYAKYQTKDPEKIPNLVLYLIKNFSPKKDKKYTFVFFNNGVHDNSIYKDFKSVFLFLPFRYFASLDQFIFVRPSFSHKVSQWWCSDDLEKYFKQKSHYISTLAELSELLSCELGKLLNFLPREFVEQEHPEFLKGRKDKELIDHRINLKGQERSDVEQLSFDNFMQSINQFFQKSSQQAMHIEEYECNEQLLPLILEQLFFYFSSHPQKIRIEGLFRKSVSIDEENETLTELMNHNFKYLQEIDNAHLIANLTKRFFAKLKTPIIPFEDFHSLMHDQGVKDKEKMVAEVIRCLPDANFIPLMFLLEFLVEKVLPEEKHTKMNSNNLAICFAPCLMRAEKSSEADLIYATKSSHVVKICIDNFHKIFGGKERREERIKKAINRQRLNFEDNLNKSLQSISSRSSKSIDSPSPLKK